MAGLPYFGRKIKLSEKAISCSSGPPPTLSPPSQLQVLQQDVSLTFGPRIHVVL